VLTTLFLLAITHPLVVVEGNAACPTPEDVERSLATIVPPVDEGQRQDRARVEQGMGELHIELLRDDGTRLAERRLSARGDCGDMAAAAAVVIATWEGRLKPEPGAPPALPAPVAVAVVNAPRRAPLRRFWFDAGAAIVGARAGGQNAAGVELDASVGGAPLGPRLGVLVSATLPRDQALAGTLVARWTRAALAAGPRERLRLGPATIDLGVSAAVALLHTEGSGSGAYALHSDTTAQLGGVVGARVGHDWSEVAVWAGFELWGWLGRQELEVNGTKAGDLPALDARLALGVSWGRFH
jgi:hypothetical protein